MEKLYPQMIVEALQTVTYAGTKKNIIESGMLADQPAVDNMNNKVTVVLEFPRDTDPFLKSTVKLPKQLSSIIVARMSPWIYKPSLNRNHDLKLERCSHR